MELNKGDIEFGFWSIKQRKPVYLCCNDEKIYSAKNLGIGFQNESNKTKELKIWNKNLEKLDNVEYLWTFHKLNQDTFDIICRMKNLKGLSIKWSSIKNIDSIVELTNLRNFHLAGSLKIEKIEPVKKLNNLITLESENLKKVKDWDAVSELIQLEGLGISGGMYQRLKLGSINYLSKLINLRYLFLIGVKVLDKSLRPLENLRNLECLRLTNDWNEETFMNLKKCLPNLKYGNVANDKLDKNLKAIFNNKKNKN